MPQLSSSELDHHPMGYYLKNSHISPVDSSTMVPITTTTQNADFPTMSPGFTPEVHQGLTICFVTLYVGLFVLAYTQLWLIFYYKHKRLSYQSVFLFLCLIWSGLRVTLFSFYFQNVRLANVSGFSPLGIREISCTLGGFVPLVQGIHWLNALLMACYVFHRISPSLHIGFSTVFLFVYSLRCFACWFSTSPK